MPKQVYMLYFEKQFEMTVEAVSPEAALAAAQNAIDRGEPDSLNWGDTGEWEVNVREEPVPENKDMNGIKDNRIVHISDAKEGKGDEEPTQ